MRQMDDMTREEVLMAALEVVSARMWAENHPEDPHHGDTLDLANDSFDRALNNWKAKHS